MIDALTDCMFPRLQTEFPAKDPLFHTQREGT